MGTLNTGLVTIPEYEQLLKTEDFQKMEDFSNDFLLKNKNVFLKYKWSNDPFHQWSRQWEYPFVYSHIQNLHHKGTNKILDLGSGLTFFPYFLAKNELADEVFCLDYDESLGELFSDINDENSNKIKFIKGDLRKLPFEDSSFDCVYCVSVLEHTDNYNLALMEINRILKPNGLLILTFDVSLDGDADIPIPKAKKLLGEIEQYFKPNLDPIHSRDIILTASTLTTKYFKKDKKDLLPWRVSARSILSIIKQILMLRRPKTPFKNLALWCGLYTKKYENLHN